MKRILLIILLLAFFTGLIITSPFCVNGFALTQNESFERKGISGSIEIDTFSTNCRLTANLSFSIRSNQISNFVLFLPSSQGPRQIENNSKEVESGLFEYNYVDSNFQGKCYTYGIDFPLDRYELVFIFGFESDFLDQDMDCDIELLFSDRLLDADWQRSISYERMGNETVNKYVNFVAPSEEEFENTIGLKNLVQFQVVKAKISRSDWNLIKSSFLWIPLILIAFILTTSSIVLKNRKNRLSDSIRFYSSVGFFLSVYLFTIRELLPPTLTWIEGVTLLEIIVSLSLLLIFISLEKLKMSLLTIGGTLLFIGGLLFFTRIFGLMGAFLPVILVLVIYFIYNLLKRL